MARSPSYPQFSLPDAIDLVRRLYKGAHRASVDTDAVIREIGYSSRSGRSLSAVGAMKQFGLIEGRDDSIRITSDALALLEPRDPVEFSTVLRAVSVKPELFEALHKEFGNQKPSESVIRSIAIRKFGFTDTGAGMVAKSYAETMSFVQSQAVADVPAVSPTVVTSSEDVETPSLNFPTTGMTDRRPERPFLHGVVPSDTSVSDNVLQFRISPTSTAKVIFSGPVTAEAISRLIKHLELSKDAFAEL